MPDTTIEQQSQLTESEKYLQSMGVDLSDADGIAKFIRDRDEAARVDKDRIANLEYTVNGLSTKLADGSRQVATSSNGELDEVTKKEWEKFASGSPFKTIEEIVDNKVTSNMLVGAMYRMDAEYTKDAKKAAMLPAVKQRAAQLIKSQGARYVGPPDQMMARVYADAEKMIAEESTHGVGAALSAAGIDMDKLKKVLQGVGDDTTTTSEQRMSVEDLMNFGGRNLRTPPKPATKKDIEQAAGDYKKAVTDGDIDKMIALKMRFPQLAQMVVTAE